MDSNKHSDSQPKQRIIIIGAGLAGLALSQGLKSHGIPFHTYERDPSPTHRAQGYRIRISPEGGTALKSLIPEHLFQAFDASCGEVVHGGAQLNALTGEKATDWARGGGRPPKWYMSGGKVWNADRGVLRSILLIGLEEDVSFGKQLTSYELAPDDSVTAHFADGSSDTGGLLIGADGIWSPVRRQLLPDLELLDTDARGIFGKTPFKPGLSECIPAQIGQGNILFGASVDSNIKLFCDVMRFDRPAASPVESELEVKIPEDYIYWVLLFNRSLLPSKLAASDRTLTSLTNDESAHLGEQLTTDWHESVRAILSEQDKAAASTLTFHTTSTATLEKACSSRTSSDPMAPNVVLLGDAAHPMPPVGAVGANTAFQDAAELFDVILKQVGKEFQEWDYRTFADAEVKKQERAMKVVGMVSAQPITIFGTGKPSAEQKVFKPWSG